MDRGVALWPLAISVLRSVDSGVASAPSWMSSQTLRKQPGGILQLAFCLRGYPPSGAGHHVLALLGSVVRSGQRHTAMT